MSAQQNAPFFRMLQIFDDIRNETTNIIGNIYAHFNSLTEDFIFGFYLNFFIFKSISFGKLLL